uniref:Uncharacterized protein n=1 Tax=Anguilla anguilla TaxID=7936 RepID=A0A0E9RWA1_ANGAN
MGPMVPSKALQHQSTGQLTLRPFSLNYMKLQFKSVVITLTAILGNWLCSAAPDCG